MESEKVTDPYEDSRDLSRQSHHSTKKDSRTSSVQKHKKNIWDKIQSEDGKGDSGGRSVTRTWHSDPDRDQISEGEGRKSGGSFYSEDYENESPSERSISPYSQSRTPSPTPRRGVRAKKISGSPLYKTGGVGRRGVSHPQRPGGQPLAQQYRRGVRSQSKESTPPKDLDLVTKRMLSARLLKINELRNALAELQQRTDELQKENRILRQLQVRQEKALQRYDDTESEISQLLSRHSNEIHVLRERLRRTQERERTAERQLKDTQERLQRSQSTISRLKKLVDQQDLGAREELSCRLEEEKSRAQEAERKLKEVERSMELSSSSFQRQLVAEKKKTLSAQEEIRTLHEELERLTNKLKEKERELDAKNIYANRMVKPSQKKDAESGAKQKVPSRSSTKAVQTDDRMPSLDFPTPPPAITDANEYSEQPPDEYLSLKELTRAEVEDRTQNWEPKGRERDQEKEVVKEEKEVKQQLDQELSVLEEKAKILRDGSEKEKDEEHQKRMSSLLNRNGDDNYKKHGHVQGEVERWNQEALANQQAAEEARRKKEQLLAKMQEIDNQNQRAQDFLFASSPSESNKGIRERSSPRPPEQIFSLTEPEEPDGLRGGSREGGRKRPGIEGVAVTAGIGRRALRSQISSDDLAFGGYAPSFVHSTSRGSSGFPPPPPKDDRESALEGIGVFNIRGVDTEKDKDTQKAQRKDKKSSLMQQLFGGHDGVSTSNKPELLNSPPTTNGVRSRREGLLSFNSGSSTPPAASFNTLHVAESRPAVRAVTSFEDDIEELAL
ncbi:lebercilin [Archocentrus centrarchus]|uniref:lebercilin n=1 Tax=Archocentrus centrarchus TaxID=63155 RepID=UPI0011E9D260|nr:lebercilin-like [Archocentrus centrarchus]XP_030576720.1 lebercilin-like [Archocentrus centrarchus]